MKERQVFTTTQVAKVCRLSESLVRQLANDGHIECYRIPGTGRHRRITRQALMDFMVRNNIPAVWLSTCDGKLMGHD